MEDVLSIVNAVQDKSLGVLSFLALMFVGYKLLEFLDQVKGDIRLMKDNHLPHVQGSLDEMVEGIKELLRIHKEKGP